MARDKRKRADGTEIDPVKDLEEFAQSFESSPEPEPAPPPDVREMVLTAADDPDYSGKKVADIIAQAKRDATDAAEARQRETAANQRASQVEQQTQIADTVRRTLAEEQARKDLKPEPVKVDPRQEKLDELWFTDPPAARALFAEMQSESVAEQMKAAKEEAKRETLEAIEEQRTKRENQGQGERAYGEAIAALQALGVSADNINRNRIVSVYATITRPPTASDPNPYYDAGGPLNPQVIVRAYQDLFGAPQQQPAPVTPPTAPRPAAPVIPVAPPGSGRPAAAAQPGRGKEVHLSAEVSRDVERLAEVYGYDPEKMKARRRARMAAEGDSHV